MEVRIASEDTDKMLLSKPASPAKQFPAFLHTNAVVYSKEGRKAQARKDLFRVMHKLPVGESPYGRAKHAQLVEKDPNGAIALFWAAINAGDRVDSALKDMAIVMRQQDRAQEAIEAIKSFRHRCSEQAQDSLDNVLIDLYKKCGRLDEQIALLKHKLRLIQQGVAFNGKLTKTARSHGKKFQVSISQETTRLLGNLGWAYMQQLNFGAAEAVYRKAQSIYADGNKACNLGLCLMKQGKPEEAATILKAVLSTGDSDAKSLKRAKELLQELELSYLQAHEFQLCPARTFNCEGNLGGETDDGDSSFHLEEEVCSWCLGGEEEEEHDEDEDGKDGKGVGWAPGVWPFEMRREFARKRNRLRVFEQITPLQNEVAY